MKNILISIIVLLVHVDVYGQTYNKQNAYLDALELENLVNEYQYEYDITNNEKFNRIIQKYSQTDKLNPFLQLPSKPRPSMVPDDLQNTKGSSNDKGSKSLPKPLYSNPTTPVSVFSNNMQSSIVNGLASFMAGRFKEEIFHSTLDHFFSDLMKEDKTGLIPTIFPETFKYVDFINRESYYILDLLLLRQFVQNDFDNIQPNLLSHYTILFPHLDENKSITDIFTLYSFILQQDKQKKNLLQTISETKKIQFKDKRISAIVEIADIVSNALLNTEHNNNSQLIFIDADISLQPKNVKDSLETRFFYGLLYEQFQSIPEVKEYIGEVDNENMETAARKMQALLGITNELNNVYQNLKNKKFEDASYALNIFKSLLDYSVLIGEKINSLSIEDDQITVATQYITEMSEWPYKDYKKLISILITKHKNIKESRKLMFFTELATITTAEELENLLKSYALPIGSSSIKRSSTFDISVNGYVGFTGGWETAYGSKKSLTAGDIGLTAPIGISVTIGNGYVTPFISFIDLGSLVNRRLVNDNTSYSNLKLEHFFTPGIGLYFNHPKLPITAGIHYSYIPNLRTITYNNGTADVTEANRSVTRFNFSLLVDIPFFTLYNKSK